mmetsp:Transcript_12766/g.18639  ORF Transcript_12766/g.18639 Transcript_12766/m.18639 type:complete len:260 (+) Transcript_12766:1046-1825(+)
MKPSQASDEKFPGVSGFECFVQACKVNVLSWFKTKKNKKPKKEYLRCKLIRGHKRIIRQLDKQVIPRRTINKFDESDSKARLTYNKLKSILNSDRKVFLEKSKTEKGPKTDGKNKRTNNDFVPYNSFNDNFCRWYLQELCLRKSFYFYIELIFSDLNPEMLCRKFDMRCCDYLHTENCVKVWKGLKFYVQNKMIQELGLEPYSEPPEEDTSQVWKPLPKVAAFEGNQKSFQFVPICEPLWTYKAKVPTLSSAFKLCPKP